MHPALGDVQNIKGTVPRSVLPLPGDLTRAQLLAYLSIVDLPITPGVVRPRRYHIQKRERLPQLRQQLSHLSDEKTRLLSASSPSLYIEDIDDVNETVNYNDEGAHLRGGSDGDRLTELEEQIMHLSQTIRALERTRDISCPLSLTIAKNKSVGKAKLDDELWSDLTGKAPGVVSNPFTRRGCKAT